jgi:ADP-heptose:LPS heptosyltransferase
VKILIIKLGALGDSIISTAIVKQILEHHASDEVHLLTSPSFTPLFSHFEALEINSFKRKGVLNKLKSIYWIRKNNFDRIYDLQSNDRTRIFCALSGAPFLAGNHPYYPYTIHPENSYLGECHSFDRLNQIIECANITPAQATPYLPISKSTVDEVDDWLKKHALFETPFAIFHAGSSPLHMEKRWPFFKALASKLNNLFKIVWVGGNDDIEINRTLSADTGIDATNQFSIFGLVELGKHARFAITNDSAPMHILSCSQIPVFGLFGPTYPRRTHALGQFDNVISANKIIASNDLEFKPSDISNISLDIVLKKLKQHKLI